MAQRGDVPETHPIGMEVQVGTQVRRRTTRTKDTPPAGSKRGDHLDPYGLTDPLQDPLISPPPARAPQRKSEPPATAEASSPPPAGKPESADPHNPNESWKDPLGKGTLEDSLEQNARAAMGAIDSDDGEQ